MKICIQCDTPKLLECFSKDSARSDNKQNTCKLCAKAYRESNTHKMIDYRKSNAHKNASYQATYRNTPKGRISMAKGMLRTKAKYPNANTCREKTTYLIRSGKLIRPTKCDTCGSSCKPNGHHPDYNHPDLIDWLCSSCHTAWHKTNTALNRKSGIFTGGING